MDIQRISKWVKKEPKMKRYDIAYLRGSENLSDALRELPFKIVDRRSGEVLGVVVPAGMLKPKKKVVKKKK